MNKRTDFIPVSELLTPKSVAVIGASEDLTKFGGRLFKLLVQHGYAGDIYPINRKRDTLLGIKTYPSIDQTPTPPDMAVMAVPRDAVKEAVTACAKAGTKAAIIITAKFSDAGEEGANLEAEIVEIARSHGMRLIGPNCLGIISPANSLTLCASPALFVDKLPNGRIGMVSQSGALMATIFDRAQTRGVGFSHCFSIGNQADMQLHDFMDFLVDDADTDVICTYIEGVKDAKSFLASARRAREVGKPVLAVKAGRTEFGAAAAFSHTASLAGSYKAFAAACRETGILLLEDTDAMILLATCMSRFSLPGCPDVAVLTTSGGGGAITADRLSDLAVPMAVFSDTTVKRLSAMFDGPAASANPIDMGASTVGGSVAVAEDSIKALLQDDGVGFVLAPITTAPDVGLICESIVNGAESVALTKGQKPWLIVVQPGQAGDVARAMLRERDIAYADSLDEAIRVVVGYRDYSLLKPFDKPERPAGLKTTDSSGLSGALGEDATKAILADYGVPVNRGAVTQTPEDAYKIAAGFDAPFVVKVVSADIVHKSDVGGVVLNLKTPRDVAKAVTEMTAKLSGGLPDARIDGYLVQEMRSAPLEMFVGANNDAQFGPMVMVGAGGVLIELLKDVAIARAPVSVEHARTMIEGLAVAPLLRGWRGSGPLDIDALAETVSRVSWMVSDLGPRFQELDANPVLIGQKGDGCVAVDARLLMKNSD